jgi:hypothetical protein
MTLCNPECFHIESREEVGRNSLIHQLFIHHPQVHDFAAAYSNYGITVGGEQSGSFQNLLRQCCLKKVEVNSWDVFDLFYAQNERQLEK